MAKPKTPIEALHERIRKAKSQQGAATQLGVSKHLVCAIVNGRRDLSNDLAAKLGFERVWTWRRINAR